MKSQQSKCVNDEMERETPIGDQKRWDERVGLSTTRTDRSEDVDCVHRGMGINSAGVVSVAMKVFLVTASLATSNRNIGKILSFLSILMYVFMKSGYANHSWLEGERIFSVDD